jgi:tRNA dimethylallyltransferase
VNQTVENVSQVILIAGPTASGKSALALELAEQHGGVVINADSMQVYRDLRIITARPTVGEEARAPHRLYGHVDAAENYSAGRWCADAAAALAAAKQERRMAVGRRHRSLFQRADARARRGAANPG